VVVGSPFHEWYAAPAKDGNCCALVNCHLIEEEEEEKKNFFLKKKRSWLSTEKGNTQSSLSLSARWP
jgi:hypothetical protein